MDKEKGWIKLHRKIVEDVFWKEARAFSKLEAWIDILLSVQHSIEPQDILIGFEVHKCERGESLKSTLSWAKRWGWSVSKVKRFLKLLEKLEKISRKSNRRTTHLKVINYESYQDWRTSDEPQVNRKRTASEPQTATDNNDKKIKNDKNNNIGGKILEKSLKKKSLNKKTLNDLGNPELKNKDVSAEQILLKKREKAESDIKQIYKRLYGTDISVNGLERTISYMQLGQSQEYPAGFSLFWYGYPKKEGKGSAVTSFSKLSKEDKLNAIKGLKKWKERNKDKEKQYIPKPATWLNERRWEDE